MNLFSEDYLAHYGVKGMKWGKHLPGVMPYIGTISGTIKNNTLAKRIGSTYKSGSGTLSLGSLTANTRPRVSPAASSYRPSTAGKRRTVEAIHESRVNSRSTTGLKSRYQGLPTYQAKALAREDKRVRQVHKERGGDRSSHFGQSYNTDRFGNITNMRWNTDQRGNVTTTKTKQSLFGDSLRVSTQILDKNNNLTVNDVQYAPTGKGRTTGAVQRACESGIRTIKRLFGISTKESAAAKQRYDSAKAKQT